MGKAIFVIAEIGINHNGDMAVAKQLIKGAKDAGCDAVKFQKRTLDIVYTKELLDSPRESPWGNTQRAQKEALEFGKPQYDEIDRFCRELGIFWFASAWDLESQKFLHQYNLKYNKIASAMLTHKELLNMVAREKRHTFVSTGMSTMEEIAAAVDIFRQHGCPFELMHCNSTYPMKNQDANLRVIETLRKAFKCDVGYSGHETGRVVTLVAAAQGATSIERHITLSKAMYGSDQAASLELRDLVRLVEDLRTVEASLGSPEKRVLDSEVPIRKKLRGC